MYELGRGCAPRGDNRWGEMKHTHTALNKLQSTSNPSLLGFNCSPCCNSRTPKHSNTITCTGVERDYSEASRWLQRAAELGNASAQVDLARCYLQVCVSLHLGQLCGALRCSFAHSCPVALTYAALKRTQQTHSTHSTHNTHSTHSTHSTHNAHNTHSTHNTHNTHNCTQGYGVQQDAAQGISWLKRSVEQRHPDAL